MMEPSYDLIIAFPGCGKSTLSKSDKALDVDFGTWRDAKGLIRDKTDPDDWEAALVDFYVDELIPRKGSRPLLTNEVALLETIEQSDVTWHVAVVVPHPSFHATWLKNLVARTARNKPHELTDDDSFCLDAIKHGEQWIKNWENEALKYECDLIYMSDYRDLELLVDGKYIDELCLFSQLTHKAKMLSRDVFASVLGNAGRLYHEPWQHLP